MSEDTQSQKNPIASREEEVLQYWKENNIFQKTLEKDSPKGDFVFYEGPPTANALPAIHHLEARVFKDAIPRYKTMRGFRVRRKGGWDTHGLPVELQVEKKLGLKSKKEIEEYGVARFNEACRDSVWTNIEAWQKFTDRIGYWVDQKDPYVTYHNTYIESLWNIVKEVHNKDLLYKDYRVVPWCTRCGTALSSHELAQGYEEVSDISVYVGFAVLEPEKHGLPEGTKLLAWTTTPWTLPGNVALAVGEKIVYGVYKKDGTHYVAAKELALKLELTDLVRDIQGKDLVAVAYKPLFPYLADLIKDKKDLEKAYQVYAADFVTTTDGTGIVHTAVMYGQDDFELGTKVGLPKHHLVSEAGLFVSGTDFLQGRYVRDLETTIEILRYLEKEQILFKKEKYKHSYPHCWRCKTALIYYARDAWYIRMSALRAELQKANETIAWEPAHIKEGRFGEWLREVKDWSISRERYWGTPLPVWKKQDGSFFVCGSQKELAEHLPKSGNTYCIMRHGEGEHNVQGVASCKVGETDALTALGRTQAQETAERLRNSGIDMIIHSSFARTTETAQIVAETLGLSSEAVSVDERLAEWNIGDFHQRPMADFFALRRSGSDPYTFTVPGGESYRDVVKRSGEFLYEVEKKYKGKKILIVSHGAVLRAMELISIGLSKQNETPLRAEASNFATAEMREIAFVPWPHNDYFEYDLHKPYIDQVELFDEEGNRMEREKPVLDVWFDSGAMPFAQDHYPFDTTEIAYPADFISEAIDQTRGWFYVLLSVGVLMGRGAPYKNVICLGHILDSEGKKMSKSVGNIVEPWSMMDKYGVDALRLWMYSVNQPGDSKNFDEKTVDEIVKKIFNPLSNIHALLALYDNGHRVDPYSSTSVLDQWILARLHQLVSSGTAHLDAFKLFEPVRALRDFVSDFSTWYIRRSRERLKSEDSVDQVQALSTTAFVLAEVAKYMAPFAPFYAEWLYREIHTDALSVHLASWSDFAPYKPELLTDMEEIRALVSTALEQRQNAGIKIRQPLQKLSLYKEYTKDLCEVIAAEVNVKEVIFDGTLTKEKPVALDTQVTESLRQEGMMRDIIRSIQDIRKTENLSPKQDIQVAVCVPHEEVLHIFHTYKDTITSVTGISNIEFVTDTQKHIVENDGVAFSLSII